MRSVPIATRGMRRRTPSAISSFLANVILHSPPLLLRVDDSQSPCVPPPLSRMRRRERARSAGEARCAGTAVGITSEGEKRALQRSGEERVVLMSDVCAVVEAARTKLNAVAPPAADPLPVEPARPYPTKA